MLTFLIKIRQSYHELLVIRFCMGRILPFFVDYATCRYRAACNYSTSLRLSIIYWKIMMTA